MIPSLISLRIPIIKTLRIRNNNIMIKKKEPTTYNNKDLLLNRRIKDS